MAIFNHSKAGDEHIEMQSSDSNIAEKLEHFDYGYGHDRDPAVSKQIQEEQDNPLVHQHMNFKLFMSLTAMSWLWVGSQIPLYLYGGVIVDIYGDVGGAGGRWLWLILGYLIPNAALCPFVGSLSDAFGRKTVAAVGQLFLILGPIVVSTAKDINPAIGGMVLAGIGAGVNELIALAGTSELVPVRKRAKYVGLVVCTITPFIPSPMWAQLIARQSNWRWVGLLIGIWNAIGLIMVVVFYDDPAKHLNRRTNKEIIREVDFVGGLLSTFGVVCFMMGMQWGGSQFKWNEAHVLAPFIIGIFLIIAFVVWEVKFAKFPMVPRALFSKDKRTMVFILLLTFFSGGNFFVVLLFWPTQVYNMYGNDPIDIGIRTLPIGFGIIGGAVLALFLIGATKGRTTILMIMWTVIMTAFTGAMSIATTTNLHTVYPIFFFAALGVGGVIIPCSIIAQIVCPTELIGTITAITLSLRYIGGAVGFTVYYNVFYAQVNKNQLAVGGLIFTQGYATKYPILVELATMAAQAQFKQLKEFIATSPDVFKKDTAYDFIIKHTQEAFVPSYRWPWWISIAFGGVCIICACGLKDIRKFM